MTKNSSNDGGLEEEISLLRELLEKAASTKDNSLELEERLSMLDSVGRAAPQLARLLKMQRELESAQLDPAALLRQALAELEEEWPELRECKDAIRSSGVEENREEKRVDQK